jgi:hypothetical protein
MNGCMEEAKACFPLLLSKFSKGFEFIVFTESLGATASLLCVSYIIIFFDDPFPNTTRRLLKPIVKHSNLQSTQKLKQHESLVARL